MKAGIKREDCTSCGTCWETCPEFYEEDPDDHFSRVMGKFRLNGSKAEGSVPDEMEDCVKEAADLCPVQIISVEET